MLTAVVVFLPTYLLFGMMIVVANLRLSGFFTMVSAWVADHLRGWLGLATH